MPKQDPEGPLDKKSLNFVMWFRKYRDIYKAAERAKIAKNQAVKIFSTPAFQDELERQDEAVRMERAKHEVQDEALANPLLDRELVKMIQLDPTKFGNIKLEAIRLGMVATGRIRSGNTVSLDPNEKPSGQANFYQALVQVQPATPIVPEMAAAASAAAPLMPQAPAPLHPGAVEPEKPTVASVTAPAPILPPATPQPATKPATQKPLPQKPSSQNARYRTSEKTPDNDGGPVRVG